MLYDTEYNEEHNTDYGIQLVALEPTEKVTLGYNDPRIETDAPEDIKSLGTSTEEDQFKRTQWSYNNAIETLNLVAQKYTGTNIQSARCVGSVPNNPTYDVAGMYSGLDEDWYKEEWKNVFKDTDNNYETDYEQLENIDALIVSRESSYYQTNNTGSYWLASRAQYTSPDKDWSLRVRYVNNRDDQCMDPKITCNRVSFCGPRGLFL